MSMSMPVCDESSCIMASSMSTLSIITDASSRTALFFAALGGAKGGEEEEEETQLRTL
mgnify:CR=1 FL=1